MTIEQATYQVRFDWGLAGLEAIGADADVVVWVDAIATAPPPDVAPLVLAARCIDVDVRTSAAAARWLLALQEHLARRITIAVVAAGERRADGSSRCAVEDHLAAGSVISHLGALGIDATSPEAATAEAAYRQLGAGPRAPGQRRRHRSRGGRRAGRVPGRRGARRGGGGRAPTPPGRRVGRRQSGVKRRATEFMQYRLPVGVPNPSGKTWPRWESQRAQRTSVRSSPRLVSRRSVTADGSTQS